MDRIVRINVTKVERTVRLNVVSNVTKIIVSQSSSGGGGGGVVTNLSLTASSENNTVSNTNGTGFIIGLATGALAGLTLNNLTNALKTAYDNAVTWISANGTNTVNHLSNTSNPHNVTKSQVGLGNVDNTSDANKPISTATQTALNLKANKRVLMSLSSDRSLTATTALQAIFNTPIDVIAGEYIFSIETTLESLATSGNVQFGVLGTAGVTSINWISNGNKQASFPTTNQIQSGSVTTPVPIMNPSTGTNAIVKVDGRIVFSSAGTFIPSFLFTTSPTTGVVKSGSSISTIRVD